MWDENPKCHEGYWRLIVVLLKSGVVVAAGLSLVFGIWDPLVSLLSSLATIFGVLFVAWVVPMWLLGKVITVICRARQSAGSQNQLNHHPS